MSDNIIDISKFIRKEDDNRISDLFEDAQKEDIIYTSIALTCAFEVAMMLKDIDINMEDNPATIKDMFVVVDAVKSLIYRVRGISYPFQDISDTFNPLEDDELAEILEDFLYEDGPKNTS